MSHLSVSQVSQALLQVVQAELQPGLHANTGLSAQQPGPGVAERLAGLQVEAPGAAPGTGGSQLRSLDSSPLPLRLSPPSLGETLAKGAMALDSLAVGTPATAGPQGPAQEPAAPSLALQEMAQAAPHRDIAAERHGATADRSMALPSSPALASNASMPAPVASQAEPLATPLARNVQVTTAAASLLHAPAARLRTGPSPLPPEEAAKRQAGHGSSGDEGGEPEGGDGDAGHSPASKAAALPGADAAGAEEPAGMASGDPLLYQQIVSALHAAGKGEGPVRLALEELRRRRRVVLATPAGLNTGLRCPAHVDVLWPSPDGGRAVRFAGELLWSQVKSDTTWLEAHLVKSQGAGSVRRLVSVAEQVNSRRVAVCLGAQAMPMTSWSQACLRVREGNRLWRALGPQWSLRLVIASLPLALQGSHLPVNEASHAH
jgi:hypothetical protein